MHNDGSVEWSFPSKYCRGTPCHSWLCQGRHMTAWIRGRWSKTFNTHHWISLVWRRSTRWDLLWQHRLSSLMQKLNIMYQWIAWAAWGRSTKVRGGTRKTGCVIVSSLHQDHNNSRCQNTNKKIFLKKTSQTAAFPNQLHGNGNTTDLAQKDV